MKKHSVALFIFIDALGWEIVQQHPAFLKDLAPFRKRLRTIFGYSSACDPSIISGRLPNEHGLWSSYYYSPQTSPFRPLRYLRFLPQVVTDSARVRGRLSQWLARLYGYTGYFQIYNIPFQHLQYFDYAEKKRIYAPSGLPNGKNIFDEMYERSVAYHVCAAGYHDPSKFAALNDDLQRKDIHLGYVTLGKLDGIMHMQGTQSAQVGELLKWYQQQIEATYRIAQAQYEDVSVYVFADHGMHDVTGTYDLQEQIGSLGLMYGRDYVAMYDSTMARFWFLTEEAKKLIHSKLEEVSKGRILPDEELEKMGVFFSDGRYGETIFLLDPGILMVPSYMGRKRIPGMHGYHPDEDASYAAMLSNRPLPERLTWIHHIYHLMEDELEEQGIRISSKEEKVSSSASTILT